MAAWLVVACVLFVSGATEVEKYLGIGGVALHAAGSAALLVWGHRRVAVGRVPCSERTGAVVGALVLGAFLVVFLLVHPIAQAGGVGGGSDGDDAIDLAVRAAMAGHDPYGIRTYLGNPATYLPGTFLMAAPFVAMGTSAYQNLLWLALFPVVLWRRFGHMGIAGASLVVLALTPRLWHGLVTGTCLVTSGIAVTCAVLGVMRSAENGRRAVLPALGLGLTVTTRANFFLVLPVVWMFVYRRAGLRPALWTAGLSTAAIAGLMLPFPLFDLPSFWYNALLLQNGVARAVVAVPYAWAAFPVVCLVVAIGLAVGAGGNAYRCLLGCAVTQACPVLLAFVLYSLDTRSVHLAMTRYGTQALFLAIAAFWAWFDRAAAPTALGHAVSPGV